MSIKTKLMTACAGVVLAGASIASAELVIQPKLLTVNNVAWTGDVKNYNQALKAGDKFSIGFYATVTGKLSGFQREPVLDGDGNQIGWNYAYDYADGLNSLSGSVIATAVTPGAVTAGKIVGGFTGNHVANTGYREQGETLGAQVDLNGDGVMDLGAPNGTGSEQAGNYVNIRTAGMSYDPTALGKNVIGEIDTTVYDRGAKTLDNPTFFFGKVTFTVTSTTGNGTESINWALRRSDNGNIEANAGLWEEDRLLPGAAKEQDPMNGSVGNISVGDPVKVGIIVPEPMSLSVLGLGAALLGFRRSRRQA